MEGNLAAAKAAQFALAVRLNAAKNIKRQLLDQATVTILKDMTDSPYGLGDDVERELQSVFERLRKYIEKSFPGTRALSIEFKEPSP